MSGDDQSRGIVGYRRPPVEHRFQKGVSGNPRGRPPRARGADNRSRAQVFLDDVLLNEGQRLIPIQEKGQIIEIAMIQAVVRSIGVAAIKGDGKAQALLLKFHQAAADKHIAGLSKAFETSLKYKDHWRNVFEECDQRGAPRPNPVPHPDDIVINPSTMEVRFNGPKHEDQKAVWDYLLAQRDEHQKDADEFRGMLKGARGRRAFYQEMIDHHLDMADKISRAIPDEETRRQPGFDLERWWAKNGIPQTLKAPRRRRPAR